MLNNIGALIISVYIAMVIYANAFFIKILTVADSNSQLFWNHLGIFLIILVPVFFLMKKIVSPPYTRGGLQYVRTGLLLVVLVGLVLSILYHVIPLGPIYDLPASVDRFFAPDSAFTIWLILPLLALFI
jgi:hypothetical protein